MKAFSFFGYIRNISIAKKLYFTVGIMALLIALELIVLFFSINTLSSVRAYVGGEGLWSKAQKDAMYQLLTYARSRDEEDYKKFKEFMKVPIGDHKTLIELNKATPDLDAAEQGFIEGRNEPADVDGMIKLFRRFSSNSYIHKAILAWRGADKLITEEFIPLGEKLHREIRGTNPSQKKIDAILNEIDPLNVRLTAYEDSFSYALGEGSRWLEHLILKLLFVVALSVECTGLLLTITVSRGIQKGLNEILFCAQAVTKGDFNRKARAFSKDEIGILANTFNQMASELEILQQEITRTNTNLEKTVEQRTMELESKNKELEQFAYVASHDLQEPIRTTAGFVELLKKQYRGRLDQNADKYIDYILQSSDRMKTLIQDLLDYSRIGRQKESMLVDCAFLLKEVLADMDKSIRESETIIIREDLPVIKAYPTELKLLFQNLIANSIKFRKPATHPVIDIGAARRDGFWEFYIRDNGIGIDEKYHERIFVIFQRLHTRTEYEGSGIGLAHCKKIAELHDGKIWVDSNPGEGSVFHFTIKESA
jgi:signal transduction histidine kinase